MSKIEQLEKELINSNLFQNIELNKERGINTVSSIYFFFKEIMYDVYFNDNESGLILESDEPKTIQYFDSSFSLIKNFD